MTTGGKLEKACLILKEPASGGSLSGAREVRFQFNPKEYTVQKGASWESKPSRGATQTSMPEFKGAEPRSMSLEVFLDAGESATGDITKDIETLFKCCTPLPESVDQEKPSPPFVVFGWGKDMKFTAFVKKVSAKYTLFQPDGTPARAACTIDLQEVPKRAVRQNPTSGGLAARRTHTVVAGDSLPSIAQREYGRAGLWRAIADANGIDDPLRLSTGRTLLIPTPDEAVASG